METLITPMTDPAPRADAREHDPIVADPSPARPRRSAPRITAEWIARCYGDYPVTLTVSDAARLTGMSPSTIRRWMRSETFAPARRNRRKRSPVLIDRNTFVRIWLSQ